MTKEDKDALRYLLHDLESYSYEGAIENLQDHVIALSKIVTILCAEKGIEPWKPSR